MQVANKISVQFFFQKKLVLNERKRLKVFVSDLLVRKGKKTAGELRIIFCSDEELLQINRDFLKHDFYTDIVTFPFTEPNEKRLEAELYISVERVKENAKAQKASFRKELHRVIFHGCLHLCDLDDKTQKDRRIMRDAEDAALSNYFNVPRATVSR